MNRYYFVRLILILNNNKTFLYNNYYLRFIFFRLTSNQTVGSFTLLSALKVSQCQVNES